MFIEIDNNNNILAKCSSKHDGTIEVDDFDFDFEIGYSYKYLDGKVEAIPNEEILAKKKRNESKEAKLANVAKILVTTQSGKVFDGDEASQDRMLRAINIADITGETTTNWKMANNSVVEVTLDELKEALALAGREMSRLWLEDN